MKPMRLVPACLLCALAGAAQAQTWPARPDHPADIAARDRLERDRWRAGMDERAAQARADALRTRATIRDLEVRRGPEPPPPPGPLSIPRSPPDLLRMEEQAIGEARQRALESERRLDALDAWIARARPD